MLAIFDLFAPFSGTLGGGAAASPAALAAPSLLIEAPIDTATTRSVVIAVAGPSSWPAGVVVQLQRQRLPGVFVDDVLTATGTTLVFPRESTAYAVRVRGFATNGGSAADSEVSGVLEIAVPALEGVGVALTARVRVIPSGSAAGPMEPRPAIVLRGDDSPNVLLVDQLANAEDGTALTPTAVSWRLEERVGGAVQAAGSCFVAGSAWRGVIQAVGGTGLVLVVDIIPSQGTRTRLRYATSWIAR